jgi:protein SCO1/2
VPTRVALALTTLVICAAAGVFGVWLASARDDQPGATGAHGSLRPPGARMPDFALTNQNGERVTSASLRGAPVVFAFVYSTCKDTCPAQVQSIRGALDDLGHDVRVIGVSVDPANDTRDRAKTFLLDQSMTGRMDFLLGTRAELQPVWTVDAAGRQRIGFPASQLTSGDLAADLAAL